MSEADYNQVVNKLNNAITSTSNSIVSLEKAEAYEKKRYQCTRIRAKVIQFEINSLCDECLVLEIKLNVAHPNINNDLGDDNHAQFLENLSSDQCLECKLCGIVKTEEVTELSLDNFDDKVFKASKNFISNLNSNNNSNKNNNNYKSYKNNNIQKKNIFQNFNTQSNYIDPPQKQLPSKYASNYEDELWNVSFLEWRF
jgi:Na+-translocating ferredoxin:NAD+ oxidoreductase RnfC subunit